MKCAKRRHLPFTRYVATSLWLRISGPHCPSGHYISEWDIPGDLRVFKDLLLNVFFHLHHNREKLMGMHSGWSGQCPILHDSWGNVCTVLIPAPEELFTKTALWRGLWSGAILGFCILLPPSNHLLPQVLVLHLHSIHSFDKWLLRTLYGGPILGAADSGLLLLR